MRGIDYLGTVCYCNRGSKPNPTKCHFEVSVSVKSWILFTLASKSNQVISQKWKKRIYSVSFRQPQMAALFPSALWNTGFFVSARVLDQIQSGFLLHLLEITMAIQTFESLSTFLLNLMDFCRCLQQSFNPWHSCTGYFFIE